MRLSHRLFCGAMLTALVIGAGCMREARYSLSDSVLVPLDRIIGPEMSDPVKAMVNLSAADEVREDQTLAVQTGPMARALLAAGAEGIGTTSNLLSLGVLYMVPRSTAYSISPGVMLE